MLTIVKILKIKLNNKKSDTNSDTNNDNIKLKLNSMSLDEKIGQLLVVGFDGYDINENIEKLIKRKSCRRSHFI